MRRDSMLTSFYISAAGHNNQIGSAVPSLVSREAHIWVLSIFHPPPNVCNQENNEATHTFYHKSLL